MSTLKMIATVAYIIICIALVIVVLMQEGKTSGLGALSGAAETVIGQKTRVVPRRGMLVKITRVLAILFVVLSVVLCTSWLD